MLPGTLFLPAGLLLIGWGATYHLPWIVLDLVRILMILLFALDIDFIIGLGVHRRGDHSSFSVYPVLPH